MSIPQTTAGLFDHENNKEDKTQGHTGGSMFDIACMDLRIGMVTLLEFK